MRKILLFMAAASMGLTSTAGVDLQQTWSESVNNAFGASQGITEGLYNAPVAVDGAGNVIASGAYNVDVTVGGSALEAIGQSAYIVKYGADGKAAWAAGLTGSVTVKKIVTDSDGNIYVAGKFADEVVFGTGKAGTEAKTLTGMTVGGAPTVKQNASFIARYLADGTLDKVQGFVPSIQSVLEPLVDVMYFYADGDVFFDINDIMVLGDELYVAATYTGTTNAGGVECTAKFVMYWGFMAVECTDATVLKMNASTLYSASTVDTIGFAGESGSEEYGDMTAAWSAALATDGTNVYAGYAGSGILNALATPAENPTFIFAKYANGSREAMTTMTGAPSAVVADNSIAKMSVQGSELMACGRIYTSVEDGENEISSRDIFVTKISTEGGLGDAETAKTTLTEGDVSNYVIASAALTNTGSMIINTLGRYNTTTDDYRNGDFAGQTHTTVYENGTFASASIMDNAVGVGVNGSSVAMSGITESGQTYALYADKSTGVGTLAADEENAPAEYYNLQGMRVANPAAGQLVIRRQGAKAEKIIVR